jgi:hypothetical protein
MRWRDESARIGGTPSSVNYPLTLEAGLPQRAGSRSVGTWLSLVEHSLGVRGVGSSNLPVPTIHTAHSPNKASQKHERTAGDGGAKPATRRQRRRIHPACEGCGAAAEPTCGPHFTGLPGFPFPGAPAPATPSEFNLTPAWTRESPRKSASLRRETTLAAQRRLTPQSL